MPNQKNTTWLDYISDCRGQDFDPALLKVEGIENLLGVPKNIHPLFQYSLPFIYLMDYTSGKYTIFSKNTAVEASLGVSKKMFEDGGIDFTISNYHKDDLRMYNNEIFPERLRFLDKIPPSEHAQYVFSYNFRFKNKRGPYKSILQRNAFIKSDSTGKPLLSLGMAINMDHYKNPNTSIQLIEKISGNENSYEVETMFKKTYFLNEEDTLLTRRETELLKYLADGLSSKQIADKLFLSEHTVIAHRKNMMAKTNAGNVTEMITWALRNEII
ncbi:MAG: response regulator transcription factor [Chitinophagaceae bacterium]